MGGAHQVQLQRIRNFQVGAYDQNQQYLGYTEALAPVFYKDSSGVMLPAELAWLPKFANGALPGSYKFGAWYSSATQPDVVLDIKPLPTSMAIKPPSPINLRSSTGDSTARISTSYNS